MHSKQYSLQALIALQPLAALGTTYAGEPFVSMVPLALEPKSRTLIIHVSSLAAHTQHMLVSPLVSLMVMAASATDVSVQATARVTIQGVAVRLDKANVEYEVAKTAYTERFPQSLDLFDFTDFSLFSITPTSARWVAGFAQAKTLSAEDFCASLFA
jgi:heme iron utilization protein